MEKKEVKETVFEFRARGISKPEMQKICKKYIKLFRKSDDPLKIVCALFLEIIYEYFDNGREKLYKLFFPTIMANFIEQGSIHSVVEEYRETKNLYSWSYTYRILNQLDSEVSLELSRLYRKVIFKIIKKTGFANKGYCVAIDITTKPFYGNINLLMVKGCKRKAGTNYGIHYLTASIIEEGVRFNLLCLPISSLDLITTKVEALVREVRKIAPIKLLFLDRAFANTKYTTILKFLKHKYIMPITKNTRLKELALCMKHQSDREQDEYVVAALDYTFNEGRAKEYHVNTKLLILHDEQEPVFFITNIYRLNLQDYHSLTQAYRYRFGIETGYRVDNQFSPFTCSTKASLRYLLMQISLIAQDLWTLVNFLLHKEEKKQPREQLKGNYSIIEIIKARIKALDFIWRPVITAIAFKRRMDKTFP